MKRVLLYKMNYLYSNSIVIFMTAALFLLLNFNALVNSGILLSGGSEINAETKYMLLMNNYISVSLFYGLLYAVLLGASTLGPDAQSGNLNILMSAYPSRVKYFIGTILTSVLTLAVIEILLSVNMILLFALFDIAFVWRDILTCGIQIFLDSFVILSITAIGSIYMKGLRAVIVGIVGYCYYQIYTFNTVPFVDGALIVQVTPYKNVLCHFLPIIRVMAPSYTEEYIWNSYKLHTILPSVELYQILYLAVVLLLGCFLFHRKDLS